MKIALIVAGGVDRSGTERVIPCLLWLIERLVRAGHEVHVFALSQEPAPGRWELLGATVRNAGRRPRTLATLREMLAEHRRARFDVIHAFGAQGAGFAGALGSMLLRAPLLLTLPGGDLCNLPKIGFGGRQRLRDRLRLRIGTARAHTITVPSRFMQTQARRLGLDTTVVPIGVALDRWPPMPPRRRDQRRPLRLLHVASLNRVKDQPALLRAAAALRDRGMSFTLDIIGCDTLSGATQRLAARLGLEPQVRFHGFLPQDALRPWFERSDLLVLSSVHEAAAIVVAEAAITGVPTVGTRVGLIADWADDASLAVPVGDAAALAAAIESLALDEDRRFQLACAARQRALGECADHTAERFIALYRKTMAERPLRALRSPAFPL